jgi:simple sugar transport system substrate-binding protein
VQCDALATVGSRNDRDRIIGAPMRITIAALALVVLVAAGVAAATSKADAQGGRPTIVLALESGRASQERQTRLLRSGAVDAAEDDDVTLDVRSLRGTLAERTELLDGVIEEGADGLVIATEDPGALRDSLASATAAGIGVVLAWSGIDAWQELGALTYVGADERQGGELAGTRLLELGSTNALCVIDNVNDRRLDQRCAVAIAAFQDAGARMGVLRALDPPGDPTGVRDAIVARLYADPGIDAILATEDDGIRWALEAVERTDRTDSVLLAAFDPDPDALRAIADERLAFGVTTEPYQQGYQAVLALDSWVREGLEPGGGQPILTGPHVLTPEDAARQLAAEGG